MDVEVLWIVMTLRPQLVVDYSHTVQIIRREVGPVIQTVSHCSGLNSRMTLGRLVASTDGVAGHVTHGHKVNC